MTVAKILRLRILPVVMFLYCVSVLTTMAGMEIFGWLSFLLVVIAAVMDRDKNEWFLGRPLLEKGDWALLALMIVIILSALIAAPATADKMFIVGNSRFVVLYLAIRVGIEMVGQKSVADRIEPAFRFLTVLIGIISLYAIFQHFTGIDLIRGHRDPVSQVQLGDTSAFRSRGMWGHPVTFGHSMALSFCMVFGYALTRNKNDRWKMIALAVVTASALALLWSYTRGAWIAIAAAVGIMVLYLGRRIAVGVYAAGSAAVLAAVLVSENFRARFVSIVSMKDLSNTQRIDVWKANIAMFTDHPILGVGYGVNEEIIGDYYAKLGIIQEFGGHAHNNYLQFLSGTGILGFAAYTAFTLVFLWMTHRLLRTLRAGTTAYGLALGALGAQIALLVGGLTECNFKDAEVNHQFMLIAAVVMVLWRTAVRRPQRSAV